MARVGPFVGWIPAGLVLPLVLLDAARYEGYRAEAAELTAAAMVVATVAGFVLGWCDGRSGRSFTVLLTGVAVASLGYLAVNDAMFRYVVPLGESGGFWLPGVAYAVLAATAGFVLGLVRRRPPRPVSAGRLAVLAAAVAVLGALAVPEFARIGAELATIRFGPGDGDLAAGRHAVYALWGTTGCRVTADGAELPVAQPAVPLTDNSDSVVTVLVGTVRLPRAAATVTADCPDGRVGDLPEIRGPLASVVHLPGAVPPAVGAVPGLLLAGWALRRAVRDRAGRVRPPAGTARRAPGTAAP